MFKNKLKFFVGAVLVLVLMLGFSVNTFGQFNVVDQEYDFSNYQVVAYGSGLTGFFDPDSGILFVYDAQIRDCIMIRQLVVPGKRLRKIK